MATTTKEFTITVNLTEKQARRLVLSLARNAAELDGRAKMYKLSELENQARAYSELACSLASADARDLDEPTT